LGGETGGGGGRGRLRAAAEATPEPPRRSEAGGRGEGSPPSLSERPLVSGLGSGSVSRGAGPVASDLRCPVCAPAREAEDADVLYFPRDTEIPVSLCGNVFGWRGADAFQERFAAQEVLGKGSYGVVRRVIDRETGAEYAAKSISKVRPVWTGQMDGEARDATTSGHLKKIMAEVNFLARLADEECVIDVDSVYEDVGRVYVVMSLCRGGTLEDRILAGGGQGLDEAATRGVVRSILEVVRGCHERGIMYRDVKPANFLFASEEPGSGVRCIDFGLAEDFIPGEMRSLDKRAGTPVYMAPELVMQRYDEKADVWSVGMLAYQALSGVVPFWGGKVPGKVSFRNIFYDIVIKDVEFTTPVWGDVSAEAIDLIRCLMTRDPERRITAAEALRHPWIAGEDG